MNLSNYPPGHPTGTRVHENESREVYECERCNLIFEKPRGRNQRWREVRVIACPECHQPTERAECEHGQPATHIYEDCAVNAFLAISDRCPGCRKLGL